MKSVGARIKKRRLELHLTQIDIYERCGIANGVLSRIENGKNVPSCTLFYKLSEVLDCSMFWLATGEPEKNMYLCNSEEVLLSGFRLLPKEEQTELLEILDSKLRKIKKEHLWNAELSRLGNKGTNDIVC